MKKIAFVLLASAFLVSCSNSTAPETTSTDSTTVSTDTTVSTSTVTAVDSTK